MKLKESYSFTTERVREIMTKNWCKHIKYWSRPSYSSMGEDFPACNGWGYIYGYGLVQTNKWMFCPICGTKRPS